MGIHTEESIPWNELSDNSDSVDYEASGYATLRRAFEKIDVKPLDVFVDLGCGMGRPLVFASLQPFRKVVGVELSPDLCHVARENLARVEQRCGEAEVVCSGAEEFQIPDGMSILYMFNPFRGDTLKQVIENLRDSMRRNYRSLTIIYVLPVAQHNPLEQEPWLETDADMRSEGLRLVIHKSVQPMPEALVELKDATTEVTERDGGTQS